MGEISGLVELLASLKMGNKNQSTQVKILRKEEMPTKATMLGGILEAFLMVEEAIDKLFLSFIEPYPLKPEQIQSAIELLDTRKKIVFIQDHKLLEKKYTSRLHKLHDKRNKIAHKRATVTKHEVDDFKKTCSELRDLLLAKAQATFEEFDAKMAGGIPS